MHVLWWMGDDVMWFVKTLALQYLFFYFYTIVRIHNHRFRLLILLLICSIAFGISYCNVVGHAISLPLFYLGVIIADYEGTSRKYFSNVPFFLFQLLLVLIICYLGRHNMMTFHISFNYLFILTMLFVLAHFSITFGKIPSWIGGSSFDVYLVHNKCLMTMRYLMGYVPFWMFAVVTLIATGAFYGIRKTIKV